MIRDSAIPRPTARNTSRRSTTRWPSS
jgi:hypothetical protein